MFNAISIMAQSSLSARHLYTDHSICNMLGVVNVLVGGFFPLTANAQFQSIHTMHGLSQIPLFNSCKLQSKLSISGQSFRTGLGFPRSMYSSSINAPGNALLQSMLSLPRVLITVGINCEWPFGKNP